MAAPSPVPPDGLKMFLVVSDGQPRVITKPVDQKLKCLGCWQTFNNLNDLESHRNDYICGKINKEKGEVDKGAESFSPDKCSSSPKLGFDYVDCAHTDGDDPKGNNELIRRKTYAITNEEHEDMDCDEVNHKNDNKLINLSSNENSMSSSCQDADIPKTQVEHEVDTHLDNVDKNNKQLIFVAEHKDNEDSQDSCEKSVFHPLLKSCRHLFAEFGACIYCGKIFNSDVDLEEHIRGHVGGCTSNPGQTQDKNEITKGDHCVLLKVSCHQEQGASEDNKLREMDTSETINTSDIELTSTDTKKASELTSLSCDYCGETFTKENLYNKHVAIHTRPFSCQACGKSFGRRSHLNRHVRGHADHICSICNLMCDSAKSLKSHRDSHFQVETSVTGNEDRHSVEDCDSERKLLVEDELSVLDIKSDVAAQNNVQKIYGPNTKDIFNDALQTASDSKKIDPEKAVKFANLDRKIKMLHKFRDEQTKIVLPAIDGPPFDEENDITYSEAHPNETSESVTIDPSENVKNINVTMGSVKIQYRKEIFQGLGEVIRCEHCGKIFLEKHEYRIHLRSHTGERPFKCSTCGKAFKQSSHLYGHMKIHVGAKGYICSVCSKTFAKCTALKKHMYVHGEYFESDVTEKNLKQIESDNGSQIEDSSNILPNHPTISANPCHYVEEREICDNPIVEEADSELLSDIATCELENNFDLTKYGGSTDEEENVSAVTVSSIPNEEIIEMKQEENSVSLQLTPPSMTQSIKLKKVWNRKYCQKSKQAAIPSDELLPNQCQVCGKMMSSKGSLRKHLHLHSGKKPYKCGVCNKSFPHSWYLTSHMKFHTDNWAHFCPLCGAHFMYKSTLKRHIRKKHGMNVDEISRLLDGHGSTAKIVSFHKKESETDKDSDMIDGIVLSDETHLATSFTVKSYACRFCRLLFSKHSYLRQHLRSHIKLRRFRCMRCNLTFRNYRNLWQHSFVHHKCHKKKWNCYLCCEQFFDLWNWKEHMQHHHPERMPGGSRLLEMLEENGSKDNHITCVIRGGKLMNVKDSEAIQDESKQNSEEQQGAFSSPEMKTVIKCIVGALGNKETVPFDNDQKKDLQQNSSSSSMAPILNKFCSSPNLALNNPCFVQSLRIQEEGSNNKKAPKCRVCGKLFSSRGQLKKHGRIHSGEKPFKCDTCGKSFTQSSHLWSHLKIHTGEKPYSCKVCSMRFNTSSSLNRHMRVHNNEKPYRCHLCGKNYRTSYGLRMHIMKHTGEKNFVCDICQRDFYEKRLLDMHYRVHTGETPFKCASCDRSFATSRQLRRHQRSHLGFNFHCSLCEKRFREAKELARHMKVHTEAEKYYCVECNKHFPDQRGLLRHKIGHINSSFTDNSRRCHKCEYCNKEFTQKRNLRSHVLARHKVIMETYPCDQCGLEFTGKGRLEVHMADEHGVVKPFECHICGSRYNWKRNLNNHIHKAHSDAEEKKFCCSFCDREFSQEHRWKSHLKTHMVFKCDTCDKEFNREYTLKNHMKVHTGESRHRCEQCGCCFSQKSNLDIHRLSHSDKREFTCEDCDKVFKFKSSLVKHFKSHHPEKLAEIRNQPVSRVEAETLIPSANMDDGMDVHEALKKYEAHKIPNLHYDSSCTDENTNDETSNQNDVDGMSKFAEEIP